MLVSVVIPTHNRARTLCAAIESVFAQTYPHIEVIVVDDGSTDETEDVLREYHGRVLVIRQPNSGPAAARNTGVVKSSGGLLAFLDSDDVWMPGRLELQVEALSKAGESVQCCVCDVLIRGLTGSTTSTFTKAHLQPGYEDGIWLNPFEILTTRFLFFNQAALIRRTAFEQVKGYNERLRFLEDTDLALRLAILGPWAFVSESLVIWQQSTDSLSLEVPARTIELKQSELDIRSRLCLGDLRLQRYSRQKRLMDCEVRRNQRQLRAVRLSLAKSPWTRAFGSTLRMLERARLAIFRRLPWYPSMKVTSFARHEVRAHAGVRAQVR